MMNYGIRPDNICHIVLTAFLTGCAPDDQAPGLTGKIKPIPAREISGSDLWIGGEVLDRD